MMMTNIFCIVCKKWLCDPQLAANRGSAVSEDPKYIKINLDGALSGMETSICAIFSCWHKAHQAALEEDGALERGWHYYENSDDISSMASSP
jgi:hypothetical protein